MSDDNDAVAPAPAPPKRRSCRDAVVVASPLLDLVLLAVLLARPRAGTAAVGWSPIWPAVLCGVRLGWLLQLAALDLCLGRRSGGGPRCVEVLYKVEETILPYVDFLCLAALCIVRLLTDEPDDLAPNDTVGFWIGVVGGGLCTFGEVNYTLEALPAVRKWARSRAAARSLEADQLNAELLDGATDEGGSPNGIAAERGDRSAAANGPAAAAAAREAKEKEEEDENIENAPTIKTLLQLVAPDWPLVMQASIFLAFAAIADVLVPRYLGQTIGAIVRAEHDGTLEERPFKEPVICLLVAAVCSGVFSSCRGATFITIGGRASARLRRQLFDALMRQEIGFFDTTKTGDLTSRMTQDCQKVSDQVQLNVNVFLRTVISTLTTLIFMFALSKELTMVSFVSVPVIVVISKKYGRVMKTLSQQTQKSLAEANTVAEESLSTMSTVRSFAAEELESERFAGKLSVFTKLVKRQAFFYIFYLACAMILPQSVTALVLFYGGKLAMQKKLEAESLLAFVFYLQTLNGNFGALGDFWSNMVQALGAASRVFELRCREPKVPLTPPAEEEAGPPKEKIRGELSLRDVRFTYPSRTEVEVLKGLSLDIPEGKVVALVGPSGNGKSTVIGLLNRLYQPASGTVTIDGVDVWKYSHTQFHQIVSIVGQEPVLYARSIRDNILFGLENPEEDRIGAACDGADHTVQIEKAARSANAHNFITSELPKGYDTEVGERGVQLSGGQKQRVAIARSLIRQPKVLLLDEATSALDAESEKQVQQAIDAMIEKGGMTVVIIAHRLSTVKNAHKICVIQGGAIVQEGTHENLISQDGPYLQLNQCQLSSSHGRSTTL